MVEKNVSGNKSKMDIEFDFESGLERRNKNDTKIMMSNPLYEKYSY
jgi:hypothetical protein